MPHTFPRRIQRLHIKYIYALHLSQYFKPLQSRALIQIRGDGAALGAGWKEVVLVCDF